MARQSAALVPLQKPQRLKINAAQAGPARWGLVTSLTDRRTSSSSIFASLVSRQEHANSKQSKLCINRLNCEQPTCLITDQTTSSIDPSRLLCVRAAAAATQCLCILTWLAGNHPLLVCPLRSRGGRQRLTGPLRDAMVSPGRPCARDLQYLASSAS